MANDNLRMPIGGFNTSGLIRATDPCYDTDTWCAKVIEVKPGPWLSYVEISDEGAWGRRAATLLVFHADHVSRGYHDSEWERVQGTFGVDSGQFGFFDEARYPQGSTGEYGDLNTFYGRACAATIEFGIAACAGVIEEGAVSSSGYGDGSYNVYKIVRDGETIALKVVFIDDEEDDEEEYNEED